MKLLPGIRTIERSILSALTPGERAHLLDLLAKILTRTAEVAAGPPEPLHGQRNRPARLNPPARRKVQKYILREQGWAGYRKRVN